jgi:hypothetical protein
VSALGKRPRNSSTPSNPRWDRLSPEAHHDPLQPVIIISRGEPTRDRDDYARWLPGQIREYLTGYTDVDPDTLDMDRLVEDVLDREIRPGRGIQLHRALLMFYVDRARARKVGE